MKALRSLGNNSPEIRLTKPSCLAPRLFFKAYCGHQPVAMAQLSSRGANRSINSEKSVIVESDSLKTPGVSYCLKLIEVSQNYRNQGIGSALLNEVIEFCKDERVDTLVGEAKGETEILRRWYEANGFDMDEANNIQLTIEHS